MIFVGEDFATYVIDQVADLFVADVKVNSTGSPETIDLGSPVGSAKANVEYGEGCRIRDSAH